jgi:hypothetical protein
MAKYTVDYASGKGMTLKQLKKEIEIATIAYEEEKLKNSNRDGTTLALVLKSRLQMLKDLEEKYYRNAEWSE